MKIETKRLILRKPRLGDASDIVEGMKDLKISRFIPTVPHPYSKKDAIWWIKESLKKWKKGLDYEFVIELKSERKVIGGISLHRVDHFHGTTECGYWVDRSYWRKGFITEAKKALIDFAFGKLKLRKIISKVFVENKASNLLQKKFGFKLEGITRKNTKAKSTGKIHDLNVYGIFKNEWKKSKKKLK